jgi:TPR repeat protein
MEKLSTTYRSALRHTLAMALSIPLLMVGPMTKAASQTPSSGGGSPSAGEQPIMGNQKYVIEPAELPRVQDDALKGSGEAALRLAMFYNFVVLDLNAGHYWLTIAAENGSVMGMYNLGQNLRAQGDRQSKLRARYWFERVVKEGQQPLAKQAEQRLQDLAQ